MTLRLCLALLVLSALAPMHAFAQSGQPNEQAQPIGGGRYEPDQRGETDEQPTQPDAQLRAQPAPTTVAAGAPESASQELASGGPGRRFDLQLWLGLGVNALDASGEGNLVRPTQEGGIGGTLGIAGGLWVGPVLIGPRVALALDPTFVLANIGIETQIALLPGDIAPFVRASIGTTLVTGLGTPLATQSDASILGIGTEIGAGVRWRLVDGLIVGAELSGGWHHLWREALAQCTADCTDGSFDLRRRGESDALTFRFSLMVGWSF